MKKKRHKQRTATPVPEEPTTDVYLLSTIKLLRTLSGAIGLLLHLWTCWIAWELDTLWWTLAYFFLFIYSELYWAIKIHLLQGLNTYSVLAGGWAVSHIILVAISLYLSRQAKQNATPKTKRP
jgi:hypothetical protein